MKTLFYLNLLLLMLSLAVGLNSCQRNFGDLNNPTVEKYLENASQQQLNNLVNGTASGARNSIDLYLDVTGVIGREIYRFADPRYTTELLGADDNELLNSNFYITLNWAARYRVVKNTNVLIAAATRSTLISDAQRKGYLGFAKTFQAHELLLNLNLTYKNGIRADVSDPDKPGPVLDYAKSLAAIAALLDQGKTDLEGAVLAFPLSPGFNGFQDAAGLIQFNRALAARVAVYREDWPSAKAALEASFLDLEGDLYRGISHVYGTGTGDQLNGAFTPPQQNGDVRLAHPSYATGIEAGDDRITKTNIRNIAASLNGLSGNRDVWVYTSGTAPVYLVRNEELILLYAEVNIRTQHFTEAVRALDRIRTAHRLRPYSGLEEEEPLIDELLQQRRYSLFFEGHRWIDVRRYRRLQQLPLDRPADNVWEQLPLPVSETVAL
ncbi:RagB/SusD family nutrient uptake outer membrane protein [Chitinophaga sp. Mgbs1]|uniref:RagB/SusD family nutrient uptake outer membrane protein n=1 Tax=Chitinophaga solisilvae TaxID=1233460 RepID=A0A3S1D1S7_9BACT|nr:RagB/SusD family nutrient uptake outer membrane protein [Chitinophaga solisilvae]